MKILRLSIANLKKKKYLTFTIILLSFVFVLFLNVGLILNREMEVMYSKGAGRLNSPDLFVFAETGKYKTSFEHFLVSDARVAYMEKEEIIYMESTKNSINSLETGAVIFDSDLARTMEPITLSESDPSVPRDKAIYLPRCLESYAAGLGDSFTLTYKNVEYDFLIAGFFETSYMGTTGYGLLKYYVPEEGFQKLYESTGTGKALSVKLKEGLPVSETADALKKEFTEATDFFQNVGGIFAIVSCLSYSEMEENMMSLFSVPMVIMIAIAFITGIITFITVYFKVKEEIDESMVNIGSLQAMGYTSAQIMLAKASEFILLGFAGGIVGIAASYAALPISLRHGESIVGISMEPELHLDMHLVSLLFVLLLFACSTILAAWRIRKITPVNALRKGIRNHHFGRNFFPLHKGKEPLFLRLALKNIFSGLRQNVISVLIIGMGVFSICVALVLFANFGYDTSSLVGMTGMEIADVMVVPLPHTDNSLLENEFEAMEEVRKISRTEIYTADIGDQSVSFTVSDNFDNTETLSIGRGSFPRYENEIALTSLLMKKLDKEIGDNVMITSNGVTKEYLISGTSVGTNNGGKMGIISLHGVHRLNPAFTLNSMNIYLKEEVDRRAFIDMLYREYGVAADQGGEGQEGSAGTAYGAAVRRAEEEIRKMLDQYGMNSVSYAAMLDGEIILSGDSSSYKIKEISSLAEYLDGQLASYAFMMKGLMVTIFLVMLLVMGAIISITIRSMIRRQREELGVYKAIGYTTSDLVRIIRLNFTVNAVAGSLLGLLAGRFLTNGILSAFFSNFGLYTSAFMIRFSWLSIIGIGTVLYIWLLSTVCAYRVRKITVYEQLTE